MSNEESYLESEVVRNVLLRQPKVAVFDVDNTLVRTNITQFYFYLMKRQGRGIRYRFSYLLLIFSFALFWAPFYLLLDFFDREAFQRAFYRRYSRFTTEEMERLAVPFFDEVLKPKLIPSTSQLVSHFKIEGLGVVLLSTNMEPVVRQVAHHFDVPYFCLKVIKSPGGSLVDLSELTDFKLHVARSFHAQSTIAVADSKHDLPVLKYVKYPFVVSKKKQSCER